MSVKIWGDFEIQLDQLLGRGGMGTVFKGRQVSLDRPAAIKVLKKELTDNPDFVKRFHREAALLARLQDANVVQVFGAGQGDGQHFYAMEYVEGEDFASRLKRGTRFTTDEVLQVALKVSQALQAAWRHRIVHRDIKPSNIILTRDGQIKVMDFGLAKNPDTDLTQSEVIMGTAKYMSPEQAQGAAIDIRSDLYSLGCVLYELATGKPPFLGDTPTAVLYQHVHREPRAPREANPSVPADLERVILRLLAKKAEDRFSSPEASASAVRGILDGVTPDEKSTLFNETLRVGSPEELIPTVKTPLPPLPPPVRTSSSAPLYFSLAAAVALLGAGGYFVVHTLQQTPLPPMVPPQPSNPPVARGTDPPPPPPPPSSPWAEPFRRGLEAIGEGKWALAYTLLEEARDKGAQGLDGRISRARASELIAKGDEEKDDDVKALELYKAAARYVPEDEDVGRKIALASYRRWSKSAERNEGADWSRAAEDWARALPHAEEVLKPQVEAARKFCETYARAMQARGNGEWAKALEHFRELAREPRAYQAAIEGEVRRAKEEVERSLDAAAKALRREHEAVLEQGRQALRRAAWAEAKAAFDKAADPKYAGLPKDEGALRELGLALRPPPGMVYVPGGKFRMGGGRAVEGPGDGDVEVAPFHLDEREVTGSDYAKFLESIEGTGGHHAGCVKEELPGKRHVPDSWASQRPEEPAVNVDWWDAASYAAWVKKRLPREAEWERAAGFDAAAGRRPYPWGDKFRKEGGPSALGIEALGSGVIEWTADWFQKYPWGTASHSDFGERFRALRGGVLLEEDGERDARVAHRHWSMSTKRSTRIGFRCAKDVEK